MVATPVDIFISHAAEDAAFRRELEEHLASLIKEQLVRVWHPGHVEPGQGVAAQLAAQLDRARVVLPLVSASYFSDPDCEAQLRRALERHRAGQALVIPVAIRACDRELTALAELAALPEGKPVKSWNDRDEAWASVVRGLRSALASLGGEGASPEASAGRALSAPPSPRRAPLHFHPLPCEPDFQGREPELAHLQQIYQRDSSTVTAILGIGGTGKSVLVSELLHRIAGREDLRPDAVFAWSFFVDQDTDRFLKEACRYLTGKESTGTASLGHLYALADALRSGGRVLLVLDGLERAQRGDGQHLGHITDAPLRLLLEMVARGCGRAFVVVTSRFPLPELRAFRRSGYEELALDQLPPAAAAGLLAARGVHGEARALEALARRFGCHALTLSLVGAALADFFDGDAARAADLIEPSGFDELDQGGKLASLLDDYARRLGPEAAALLERMSAFSGPTRPRLLEAIFLGPGKERVAGALARLDAIGLRAALARLKKLRLVERVDPAAGAPEDGERVFTVHAAIKDHFYRRLMLGGAASIHSAIQESLASMPTSGGLATEAELDIVEEIIHHARQAGHAADALQFYEIRLGAYEHLGATARRGRRA